MVTIQQPNIKACSKNVLNLRKNICFTLTHVGKRMHGYGVHNLFYFNCEIHGPWVRD